MRCFKCLEHCWSKTPSHRVLCHLENLEKLGNFVDLGMSGNLICGQGKFKLLQTV